MISDSAPTVAENNFPRKLNMDEGWDMFDWNNTGKSEADRRRAHEGKLEANNRNLEAAKRAQKEHCRDKF